MTTYTTTFAGQATGSNSTEFTDRYTAETAVSVENPAVGEEDDRLLQFGTGDSGFIFQSFDNVDGDANRDNSESLSRYQLASDAQEQSVNVARASGSASSETCYTAYIDDDDFVISRWDSGTETILSTRVNTEAESSPYRRFLLDTWASEPNNKWIWCRFRVNGTGATVTLQAKWWIDGDPEPSDWTHDITDTSASRITAAGWTGFGKRNFTGNTYLDYFSVGTNGDSPAIVASNTANVLVTQSSANVLYDRGQTTNALVTQSSANVLYDRGQTTSARVTQITANVVYSVAPSSTTQTVVCIINT